MPDSINEFWSMDFIHAHLSDGRTFRAFNVIDDPEAYPWGIHPTPVNNFDVGEVGLPHLVYSCRFITELIGRLHHDKGWT